MGPHGIFRQLARRPGTYAFLSAIVTSLLWYLGVVSDGIVETLGVALVLLGVLDLDVWDALIGISAPFEMRLGLVAGLCGAALAMIHGWGVWWFFTTAILSTAILIIGTAYLIGNSRGPHRFTSLARRWRPAWEEEENHARWVLGWGLVELSGQEMFESVLALLFLLPIFVAIFLGLSLELTLLSGPVGVFLLGGAGVAGLANVESRSEVKAPFFGSGNEEKHLRSGVLEVFLDNAYRLPVFLLSLWLGLLGLTMVFRAWRVASGWFVDPAGYGLVFEDGIAILALLGIASVIGFGIYDVLRQSNHAQWCLPAHLGLGLQALAYLILMRSRISLNSSSSQFFGLRLEDGHLVLEAFLLPGFLDVIGGMNAAFLLSFLVMLIGLKLFLSGRSGMAPRFLMGVPAPLLSVAGLAVLIGLVIQPGIGPFVVPLFAIAIYPLSRIGSSIGTGGRLDEDRKDELLNALTFVVYSIGSFQMMAWLIEGETVKAGGLVGLMAFVGVMKARPEWVRWPAWIFFGVKPLPESEASEDDHRG